ncbi:MAG: helix-turn-helix domain-containing protein [Nitrospinaceae bacterium]|nr:helix-turn-helix domain-containing protein [Nitrospinaceae bacterium]
MGIEQGNFRQDLFYRLNVFPIEVPPLRKRKEDIPLLAQIFLESATHKFNRPLAKLTQASVMNLQKYDWPGNVRELQNVIERSVIISRTRTLRFDLPESKPDDQAIVVSQTDQVLDGDSRVLPDEELRRMEHHNLLKALQQTRWQVAGSGGAAELLGIKPTTLASRIKKMNIKKPG